MSEPSRRTLNFDNLSQAAADAQSLLNGYDSVGKWSLGQVCGHCSDWLSFTMDGYPKGNFFIAGMLWMMKVTVGKGMMKKAIATGKMKAGAPTMPQTVPDPGSDDREAVERFVATVKRFESFDGELHPSPLFGAADKETTTKLHLVHTAHHLSFLIPKSNS